VRAQSARGLRANRTPAPLVAYVLHRYDWSESSLILDVFTREQGRLTLVAKGAKRPYSQLRGVLLPFQRLNILLSRAAVSQDELISEAQNLSSAEWAGGAAMLTGAALFSGFYLNELLMKLLARRDAHPQLFDVYAETLPELVGVDELQVQAALRAFELKLLQIMGWLPDLSCITVTQQPVKLEASYELLPELGVNTVQACELSLTGLTFINMQAALEHGNLQALQQACRPSLWALKGMLRSVIQHHLGSAVLRTRQVMLSLQNLSPVDR
jgi:DNA repair protein RecO (recombination protein O)